MKEGWEYKKLGEVAFFTRGLTYSKKDETTYSNNVVLRSNNIDLLSGKVIFDELKYLSSEFVIPEDKKVKKGSLLMCMSNGSKIHLGKVGLIKENNGYAFGGFMSLVTPSQSLNSSFFYYALTTPIYKQYIKSLSEGANINNLKIKDLEKFVIPIPPLSEQQEIVEYLDSSFTKIDALKANAAKNLEEAKSLFQSALKEALEPKEGWEEKKLSEIVDSNTPISYGIVQPGEDTPNGIPVVRPVDLIEKYISLNDNIKRTSKENSESYKRTILNGKEILMCVRGTTGIVSLSDESLKNCNVTRGIVPLKISDDTKRLFVYYTLIAPIASDFIQHKTKGAALKQINIADVKMIPINLPTYQEQQSIVSHLDSLNEKVNTLQQNYSRICNECDALKQAILRQVFE